jgi:TPR repeat protein
LQRKRLRNRNIALVVVSSLAVLAVLLGLFSYGSLKVAVEQKKQADDILEGATNVFTNVIGQMDIDTKKQLFAVMQIGMRHGSVNSMTNLGWLYEHGQGVTQDYVKARELYEKSIDMGDSIAMFNLGLLYLNGQGVARELYEKAADRGDASGRRLTPSRC